MKVHAMILRLIFITLVIEPTVISGWKNKLNPARNGMDRPEYVLNALSRGESLYYFGLGSNMLRSKIENRSSNGKIHVISMEPAMVPGHRLAFNMRGFLPLEPGMGSLEPLGKAKTSRPLLAYTKPECHGALILLDPENYEKVMQSEGVSHNSTMGGYEEIVVDAYPYGSSIPVKAVALRAKPHVRLKRDPAPSLRYITILRQGAAELGLEAEYQEFLAQHPVQNVPGWLRRMAVNNLVFTFVVSSKLKTRIYGKFQSWLLFGLYDPSVQEGPRKAIADGVSAVILLPGCLFGYVIRRYFEKNEKMTPPFLGMMMKMFDDKEEQS